MFASKQWLTLVMMALWIASPVAVAVNAAEQSNSGAFKVVQYLERNSEGDHFIINAGNQDGILEGSVFKTYRQATPTHALPSERPMMVLTGKLKAIDVQPTYTVAKLVAEESQAARAVFAKFPGVMAGDLAINPRISLSRHQVVTPEVTLGYFDLFEDPKAMPSSFELTTEGIERIKEAVKPFMKARLSLLLVEGYTDGNGPSEVNRVESYQRALTVRQFLINNLGFDEKRIEAFGFGEAEPVDSSMAPGYIQANRRIVLKAVPLPKM